jgi:hypothetical protein
VLAAGAKDGPIEQMIEDVGSPSEEQVAAWEQQQLVREGLRMLGGRCERLLRMLFMLSEQCDYQTISAELGIPVGGIGPTRARCLKKMEGILASLGLDPSPAAS